MNLVIIAGRLTKDPELKLVQEWSKCEFTLAVDRYSKGEKTADFFNCVAWNQTAINLTKWQKKGNYIIVTGNLTNQKFTGTDGVDRYTTKINVDRIEYTPQAKVQQPQDVEPAPPEISSKIDFNTSEEKNPFDFMPKPMEEKNPFDWNTGKYTITDDDLPF